MLYRTVFVVRPLRPTPFPIDMLRYETAYPHTETDSNTIQNRTRIDPAAEGVVLEKLHSEKKVRFTPERWVSFGWEIATSTTDKVG